MSVKRYDIGTFGGMSMESSSDGAYVRHDDYAALEARCAALVAENAGLKAAHADAIGSITKTINRGSVVFSDTPIKFSVETPATDAFLAEVRAQGADECVRQLVISDDDDFSDAPNICAMVAHQLRKGVQS